MDLNKVLEEFDTKINYSLAKTCTDDQNTKSSCPICLSNRYYSGQPVKYTCPQLRYIYVLRYLPVHIRENLTILEGLNAQGINISWRNPIEVLSLGGGPGSEIAAFQLFVQNNNFFGYLPPEIQITRLDRVKEWDEIYKNIIPSSENSQPKYKYFRITDDACTVGEYKGEYDLVFLSYLVSELTDANALELGKSLSKSTKKNFILIFNDRNEEAVVNRINLIINLFTVSKEYTSTETSRIDMTYPQEIRDRVKPKLTLSSYRRGVTISK